MASTSFGTSLTESHREEQARLALQVMQESLKLWALLPVDDMDLRRPDWQAAMGPLLGDARSQSQQIANGYYRSFSQAETGLFRDIPPVGVRFDRDRLLTTLDITGPARFKSMVGRGLDPGRAWQVAGVAVAGASARLTLEAGRQEIDEQVRRDPNTLGWQRVASDSACPFCMMLVSRGPVYKEQTATFQSHDACQCTAEPIFKREGEWTDQAREARQMWNDAQRQAREAGELDRGTSNDALNAFRRYLAG
jgi:hypothetical protein